MFDSFEIATLHPRAYYELCAVLLAMKLTFPETFVRRHFSGEIALFCNV